MAEIHPKEASLLECSLLLIEMTLLLKRADTERMLKGRKTEKAMSTKAETIRDGLNAFSCDCCSNQGEADKMAFAEVH